MPDPAATDAVGLHLADHCVIGAYVGWMLFLGAYFGLRRQTSDEYFLGNRRLPWFAVGISVIASLLSSITYLGEPGGVWRYGFGNLFGKMIAIPIEVVIVFGVLIPFLTKFRFVSAYEYLEARFDRSVRLLGASLFLVLATAWMGVVVLVSSRALAEATGVDVHLVLLTVGICATLYTLVGGIRAVVWTDVVQVALLVGGGVAVVASVAWTTSSTPVDWIAAVHERKSNWTHASWDPTLPATTMTLAATMLCWHICTQSANQMTLQRYFSTSSPAAARRSFLTAVGFSVFLNVLLVMVGAAILFHYTAGPGALPDHLDPRKAADNADRIFPHFILTSMPPGVAGAIFAAMLAAAMSSIDSAVNSVATVLTVDFLGRGGADDQARRAHDTNTVASARVITLLVGSSITVAAILLHHVTLGMDIIALMPRSFNCFLGALGGLFLGGMLLPTLGARGAWVAAMIGLATALGTAYSDQWLPVLRTVGEAPVTRALGDEFSTRLFTSGIGFSWVLPASLVMTMVSACVAALVAPESAERRAETNSLHLWSNGKLASEPASS